VITLEQLPTGRAGFDLDASPLQRAITRAADGRPLGEALTDVEVVRHFGCERSQLGLAAPVLVAIIAGVRSGKSLMAACAAVKGTLTADLAALKAHEVARFAIVAPTVDNAGATFRLLVGSVEASPALARMVVGEPTADTITLRRPDGRLVEIVVVAAHRGAVTLRSRWLVGFVLDEVALFGAESTGAVVNAEELVRAGETRLVPGGQGWLISSPFGPSGVLYDLFAAHFGKPGRVLVVHAPTRAMNPAFPAEQVEAIRARAPDVAAREYDAEWVDADTAFLDGVLIDKSVRAEPLEEPPIPGVRYTAAWDAATRGNAWTLVLCRGESMSSDVVRVVVALARQWIGSKRQPLDPDMVIAEIAEVLARYGVDEVACDEWGADALQAVARVYGLTLLPRTMSTARAYLAYDEVRTLLTQRRLELPPHAMLVQDLKGLRKKATASALRIELPRTSDGRHGDFAPSIALAVGDAATELLGGGGWCSLSPEQRATALETVGVAWNADGTFGQREKRKPPIQFWTLTNGEQEAVGQPVPRPGSLAPYSSAMVARWTRARNNPTRFSAACSPAFKSEIETHRMATEGHSS